MENGVDSHIVHAEIIRIKMKRRVKRDKEFSESNRQNKINSQNKEE